MDNENIYLYFNKKTMIIIDDNISNLFPNLKLGVLTATTGKFSGSEDLWFEINNRIKQIKTEKTIKDIREEKIILESKKAYKLLGKDPNRYRLSAEALLKRIIANKPLYKINNTVDIINLISIETYYSICAFNSENIFGDIHLSIGKKDEDYIAIGRGSLNIENLIVFRDSKGAFGSPTSDSVRTQIDDSSKKILIIIISFNGSDTLTEPLERISYYLEKYSSASNCSYKIY